MTHKSIRKSKRRLKRFFPMVCFLLRYDLTKMMVSLRWAWKRNLFIYLYSCVAVLFLLFLFTTLVYYGWHSGELSWCPNLPEAFQNFAMSWAPSLLEDIVFFLIVGLILFLYSLKDPRNDKFIERISNLLNADNSPAEIRLEYIKSCRNSLSYIKSVDISTTVVNYNPTNHVADFDINKDYIVGSLALDNEACQYRGELFVKADNSVPIQKLGLIKSLKIHKGSEIALIKKDFFTPLSKGISEEWKHSFVHTIPRNGLFRYEFDYSQAILIESEIHQNYFMHNFSSFVSAVTLKLHNTSNFPLVFEVKIKKAKTGESLLFSSCILNPQSNVDYEIGETLHPNDSVLLYFNQRGNHEVSV